MAEERVQRRLAAVLAADVVGYSRMMGADEAGTLARLKSLRAEFLHPRIAEYGGRIVKTTGDGTLIEFGSAVDAVSHAVAVQRGMSERNAGLPEDRQIRLRIGINVGDIIIDGDDIHGDGVNVAARLEALAEPGGICISARVHDYVGARLDVVCEDLGRQAVKNIADPVHVFQVLVDGAGAPAGLPAPSPRPSIAVLPFQNMSGDPDQEYFSDGITEDIITALSFWRSFPVIARNSTFAYKGQSPDIRRVGRELGARYVIEGSVRKSGSRVRVTAQLIDTETGHHLWAERYDRQLEDIFDLQDELSQRIAATVAPEIEFSQSPATRTRKPQNLDAWDLVQRSYAHVFALDAASITKARDYFSQAIELDPAYARAYAGIAWSYHRELWLDRSKLTDEVRDRFLVAARKAVSLDDGDSSNHAILALTCLRFGENDRGLAEARRALQLNPNNANAHELVGSALTLLGRPDEARPYQERALSLSPRDPRHGVWFWTIALTHLAARQYEDAVDWAQQAIQRHPTNPDAHIVLASALGHLGRGETAREIMAAYAKLMPQATDRPRLVYSFKDTAAEQHLYDGLGKAAAPQ